MSHQLRLKKQLFLNQECYLYEAPAEAKEVDVWTRYLYVAPAEAEETVVWNWEYYVYEAPAEAEYTSCL